MRIRWFAMAVAMTAALAVACDKSKEEKAKSPAPEVKAPEATTPESQPPPPPAEPKVITEKGAVIVSQVGPGKFEVKHKDGAFSLVMAAPSAPTVDVAKVPIEAAGVDVEMTQVMAAHSNGALGLTWGPMGGVVPKDETDDVVVKAGLDGGRDNMLASMGATLQNEQATTLGGAPARKLEAGNAQFAIRAWLLYVPEAHSMLALMAVGPPGNTAVLQKVDDMAETLKLGGVPAK